MELQTLTLNGVVYDSFPGPGKGVCYESLSKAVADLNSGTEENRTLDNDAASVIVVPGDNGIPRAVLLKDCAEAAQIDISTDMVLVLNGKTLSLTAEGAFLNIGAGVCCEINGEAEGSTITKTNVGTSVSNSNLVVSAGKRLTMIGGTYILKGTFVQFAMPVKVSTDAENLTMDGCSVWAEDETANGARHARAIQTQAKNATIRNCTILVGGQSNVDGILIGAGNGYISNCSIRCNTASVTAGQISQCVNVFAGAVAEVENCTMLADAPDDTANTEVFSYGILNFGTLHSRDNQISSARSGISNGSGAKLYVEGGSYTGFSHGGIYFSHGRDGIAYVNDAGLRCGYYEGVHDFTGDNVSALGDVYVGGTNLANGSNMTVYLDGCIIGGENGGKLCIRNTSGEVNNTVNISNSTITEPAELRIDDGGHKVNVGMGTNITADVISNPEYAEFTDGFYRRLPDEGTCSGKSFNAVAELVNGRNGNSQTGEVGGYYSPKVTQVNENTMKVSFTASKEGMAAVADQEITLPAGKDGEPGKDGTNGQDGSPGKNGSDGVSVTHEWNGTVLKVTSASGTSSADLKGEPGKDGNDGAPGSDGADGHPGEDGVSPVVAVSAITGGHRITITDVNGEKTVDVMNGEDAVADDEVPEYWLAHLSEKVSLIREAMLEVGVNKSAFFFYTDSHWSNDETYTAKMAPKLLKYLCKHTPINKVNYGGDIVNDEAADSGVMAYLWEWRKMLYGLPSHHSVVGNHDDGNTTDNLFSENYVYGYLLAPEETADIVRGESGMYYYIDNPSEKTRYLYLDTAYRGVDDAQLAFVKAALTSTSEGWHIVVIAHEWYKNDYTKYPPVLDGVGESAQTLLAEFDAYNARTGDYSACNGWVEFCIGGHYHLDYDGKTAGGIPVILVEADTLHDRGGTMPQKGTTDEAAVSAVIADYTNKVVNIIRVGRGADREITIDVSKVKYTNVIPLSIGSDGAIFNSGKGWADKSRIGSGGIYLGSANDFVTGHIALKQGVDHTFSLKNVGFPKATDNGNIAVALFTSDFKRAGTGDWITPSVISDESNGYHPVFDGDNIVEFTLNQSLHILSNAAYVAFCCTYLGDDSIITINEPIE